MSVSAPSETFASAGRLLSLVARREVMLLRRSRAGRAAVLLVFAMAWLPPILIALRAARLGIASFTELTPLALAVSGVLFPLLSLLAGCGLFAGEIEDRTLVPVLCLPVPRTLCYFGKLLGLGLFVGAVSVAAFGSVEAVVWAVRGAEGAWDYLVVSVAGLLLAASSLGMGAALGAGGGGRVRAYGATLLVWLMLVFALDAVLLAAILATAPPAPESVGHHGHDELSLTSPSTRDSESEVESGARSIGPVWLAVDPVSLFRWSALNFSPQLRSRWQFASGSGSGSGSSEGLGSTVVIAFGWLVWIVAPGIVGWKRFSNLSLS